MKILAGAIAALFIAVASSACVHGAFGPTAEQQWQQTKNEVTVAAGTVGP
jgi:hypothetical protein